MDARSPDTTVTVGGATMTVVVTGGEQLIQQSQYTIS